MNRSEKKTTLKNKEYINLSTLIPAGMKATIIDEHYWKTVMSMNKIENGQWIVDLHALDICTVVIDLEISIQTRSHKWPRI
jgi:hypothetical protein